MVVGEASKVRPEYDHGQGYTGVRLRRPGRWLNALMVIPVVLLWAFGGGFAALMMAATSGSEVFFAIWLTGWIVGGLFLLVIMLWRAFATETLIIRSDGVTLMRRLFLIPLPTVLPANEITDLRWIADDPMRSMTVNGRRVPQSALQIAGSDRTYRFARGIGEKEADGIIAAIRQRLAVSWKRR